jgi:hypothetical protein
MREGDAGRDGGDLQGAAIVPAMAALVLGTAGRDVPLGQVLDLGVQAGLVFFTARM